MQEDTIIQKNLFAIGNENNEQKDQQFAEEFIKSQFRKIN